MTDAYLPGVVLRAADLRQADLSRTDLRGADLRCTDLEGVDLTGADLTGARIAGINLKNAYTDGMVGFGTEAARAGRATQRGRPRLFDGEGSDPDPWIEIQHGVA